MSLPSYVTKVCKIDLHFRFTLNHSQKNLFLNFRVHLQAVDEQISLEAPILWNRFRLEGIVSTDSLKQDLKLV